jgi:hypothetical protein
VKITTVPGTESKGFEPTDLYGISASLLPQLFKSYRVKFKDMADWTLESRGSSNEESCFIPCSASFMPWFLNPLLPMLYPEADRATIRRFRNLSALDHKPVEYKDILNYFDLLTTPMATADPLKAFAFLSGFCKHGASPVCAGFADLMSRPVAKNMARSSHWARMHDPSHVSFLRLVSDAMNMARDFFLPEEEGDHCLPGEEGWLDNIHSPWPIGPRLGPENTVESYAALLERNPEVFTQRATAFFSRMAVYAPGDAVSLTALWDDLKSTVGVEHWQHWMDDAAKAGIEYTPPQVEVIGEWFVRSRVMRPAFAELLYAHATTVSGGDSLWRMETETVTALANTPWTPPEEGISFEMVDEGDFMLPFPGFYLELEPGALTLDASVSGDRRPWTSDEPSVIDVEGVFICQSRACTGVVLNGVQSTVPDAMAALQRSGDAKEEGTIQIGPAIEHGIQITAVGRPQGLYQLGKDLYAVDEQWVTVHLCGDVLGAGQEGGRWEDWPEDSRKLARFAANFLLALNQEQLDTETVTRTPRVKNPGGGGGGKRRRPKSPKEPFTKVRLGQKARQVSRASSGKSLGKLLKPVRVSKHRAFFWVLDPGERKPWATKVRDDGRKLYKIRRPRKAHERGKGRVTSRNYDVTSETP